MFDSIRILMLEDSADDADLIQLNLEQQGIHAKTERVETRDAFVTALEQPPDLILLDYSLPTFNGVSALKLVRERGLDIPCIFISGTYGEDILAGVVDLGADDFLLKDRLGRLGTSVRRAMEEKKLRQQKQHSEAALHESERQMRSMLDNLHLIAIILDVQGNVTYCNDFLLQLTGWSKNNVLGKGWFEQFIPSDWADVKHLFTDATETGGLLPHYENPILTKDGAIRLVSWNNTVLHDINGRIIGTASIGEDVTDKRQTETLYQTLFEFAPVALFMKDREGRYTSRNAENRKYWDESAPALGQTDNELVDADTAAKVRQQDLDVMETGQTQVFEQSLDTILGERFFLSHKTALRDANNHVVGVLGASIDLTEQKRAEQELHNAKNFLQATLDALSAHIAILDENGAILTVNAAWQKFGNQNDLKMIKDGIGGNYLNICDAAIKDGVEDARQMAAAIRQILAGEIEDAHVEYPCHSPTEQRWFMAHVTRFFENDKARIVVAHENITERKLAEMELRESENRYRQLIAGLPVTVYITDIDGYLTLWNEAAEKMWGRVPLAGEDRWCGSWKLYSAEGLPLPHEDCPMAVAVTQQQVIRGAEAGGERPDGSRFTFLANATPLYDETGEFKGAMNVMMDITERKEADEKVRESETKLRTMLDTMSEGIALNEIVYDESGEMIDYRIVQVNRAFYNTADFTGTEVIGSLATKLYGMDQEVIKSFWQDRKGREDIQRTEFYSPITNRAYYVSTSPFVDDKFVTSFFDITERKLTEDKLRESEIRFRSLVENSSDEISIISADGTLLYESPSTNPTLGYKHGEYLGRDLLQLVHVDDVERVQRKLSELARDPDLHPREQFRIRHQNGDWIWVEAVASNMLDEPSVEGIVINYHDVTERIEADLALQEAERDYRSIYENASAGIFRSSPQGRFLKVNSTMAKMYGYDSAQDMLASITNISEQIYFEPDDRVKFQRALETRGGVAAIENQNLRKDGSVIWTSTNARPVKNDKGEIIYYEGFIQDITERKHSELVQRSIYEIAYASTITQSLDDLYPRIHEILQKLLPTEFFYIALYEQDADILSFPYFIDAFDAAPAPAKPGHGLTEYVLRTQKPLLADRPKTKELIRAGEVDLVGADSNEWLGVPLMVQDKAIGVMVAQSYTASIHFSQQDMEMLEFVSTQVANAIERRQTEEKLIASQRLFQGTFDVSPLASVLTRLPERTIVDVSPSYEKLVEYTREESIGKSVLDIDLWADPVERQKVAAILNRDGGISDYEFVFKTKSGKTGIGLFYSATIDLPESNYVIAKVLDITDRKQAEDALKESEQTTRLIIDTALDAVITMNADGCITNWNEQAESIFGWNRSDAVGKALTSLIIPPSQRAAHAYGMNHYRETGEGPFLNRRIEVQGQRRDGSLFPLELAVHDLQINGKTSFAAFLRDITERRQSEDTLRQFRFVMEQSNDAILMIDPATSMYIDFNERASAFLGYTPDELKKMGVIHVSQNVTNLEAWHERVKVVKESHGLTFETIYLRKDGSQFPVEISAKTLSFEGREILVDVVRDITERKHNEETLRQFKAMMDQSNDAIYMIDPATSGYIDFNRRAYESLGYSSAELHRLTAIDVAEHIPNMDVWQMRTNLVIENKNLIFETTYRRKDNTVFPVEVSAQMIEYDNREIMLAVVRDISERKLAEDALRESESRFAAFFNASPVGIAISGIQSGKILDVNPAFSKLFGYDRQEMIGRAATELQGWINLADRERLIAVLREKGHIHNSESKYQNKSGEIGDLLFSMEIVDIKNEKYILTTALDITERKQAQEIVLRSRSELAKAQAMAHLGSYNWNIQNGQNEWSEELKSIWGVHVHDQPPSYELTVSMIHPDDLEFVQESGRQAREENRPFDVEYRIVRDDGSVRYLHDRAEIVRDSDGTPLQMFGSVLDITERVLAESERRYLFEVIEKSINEVYIFDSETLKFIYVNQGALGNLQHSLDEMKEMTPVNIKPEHTAETFNLLIQPLLNSELDVQIFETVQMRADGSIYPVEVHLQLVDFESGRVFLAVIYDITERKLAQETIREAEAKFQNLVERLPLVVYTSEIGINGKWEYISPQIEELLGYTPQEWMADPSLWYQSLHPDDRTMVEAAEESAHAANQAFNSEYRIYTKNGREIWVRDSGQVTKQTNDGLPIVQGILIDITERKLSDEKITRYANNTAVLYEVSQQIRTNLDLDQLYQDFHQAIQKLMSTDAFVIALFDESKQEVEDVYLWDNDKRWPGTRYAIGQSLTSWVITSGRPMRINNWNESNSQETGTEAFGYTQKDARSVLAVPLFRGDGKCFGMVSPQSYAIDAYSAENEQLLVTLANQLSKTIENAQLFKDLQQSNQEIIEAYNATIEGWSRAMDLRDKETEGHTQRVTELTLSLAQAWGFSEDQMTHIRRGGLLHDIGKLGVPDKILFKKDNLSKKEWETMRKHPAFAHAMLSHVKYLEPVLEIPYCHHEKWDGSGYPQGLKGEQIPLAARIFAVADVWDAVTSNRPYRDAWTKAKATRFIKSQSGKHFDPLVVERFLALIPSLQGNPRKKVKRKPKAK